MTDDEGDTVGALGKTNFEELVPATESFLSLAAPHEIVTQGPYRAESETNWFSRTLSIWSEVMNFNRFLDPLAEGISLK